MKTATRYIAVTAAELVEAGSMCIIWGIGATPELALDNAEDNVGRDSGYEYDILPASDRLADYVERYGADADLDWIDKNDAGVADLLEGAEF